jgi:hypothetical protein
MEHETLAGMATSSASTSCRSAIRPFRRRPLSSWYKAASVATRQSSSNLHHDTGQTGKPFRPEPAVSTLLEACIRLMRHKHRIRKQ